MTNPSATKLVLGIFISFCTPLAGEDHKELYLWHVEGWHNGT